VDPKKNHSHFPTPLWDRIKTYLSQKKIYKDELVIQKMNEKSSQPKISNFLNALLISKKKKKTRSTHEYE
jgi:hypothetical protein